MKKIRPNTFEVPVYGCPVAEPKDDPIKLESIGPIEDALVREYHARLKMGREQYGPFKEDDGRDWVREALEEILDAVVYISRALMRLMVRKGGGS